MKRLILLISLSLVIVMPLFASADANEKHIRFEVLPGFSDPYIGYAFAVNNSGQIVGCSGQPGTLSATLWERGHGGRFHLVNLGIEDYYSCAHGINDLGDVVGSGSNFAFLWRNGQTTVIAGGGDTISMSINNNSQIVGYQGSHGFLWDNGMLSYLPSLGPVGDERCQAYGINNHGQIVGWSVTGLSEAGAVTWKNGEIIALGNYTTEAYDINDSGQIVGMWGGPTGNGAFLWQDGIMTTFWGENSIAQGVNECGQVVGYRNVYPDGGDWYSEALLFDNGVERVLPVPVDARGAIARSINDRGQIVGEITTQDWNSQPILWTIVPSPQRCRW